MAKPTKPKAIPEVFFTAPVQEKLEILHRELKRINEQMAELEEDVADFARAEKDKVLENDAEEMEDKANAD